MTSQPPSLGRIVHVVLKDGQHRAAIVAHDFGNDRPNLDVVLDLQNDLNEEYFVRLDLFPEEVRSFLRWHFGKLSLGSAVHDEDTKAPGTWHWPEKV